MRVMPIVGILGITSIGILVGRLGDQSQAAAAPPTVDERVSSIEARVAAIEGRVTSIESKLAALLQAIALGTSRPAAPDPEARAAHDAEVDRWIKTLQSGGQAESMSATIKLGELKDLRAVPALVEALKGSEWYYTRLGAAAALGELRACDAVPALIEAFEDSESLVQVAASDALDKIAGSARIPTLKSGNGELHASEAAWAAWWKTYESKVRRELNQAK